MQITVPPADPSTSSWRKTITALTSDRGGAAVQGTWLQAGDVIDAPAGTLVVAVDKTTTGFTDAYRSGDRVPVQDATVAVHLITDGGLTPVWSRHYKTAASAFGATTIKKLTALLAEHPAPAGEIRVVEEAQRPNRRAGSCRWCQLPVNALAGHLVGHGEHVEIEHYRQCPTRYVTAGTPCALCGVTVSVGRSDVPAAVVMVREGVGRWETRHGERVQCTTTAPESDEEYSARIAAQQAAAAERRAEELRRRQEADARRVRKAAERDAAAAAAEAAETARVAALTEVSRSSVNLNDKSLGGTRRAALDEITISLSDGTSTTRWVVRTYRTASGWTGEDGDPDESDADEYTSKKSAQFAYRRMRFEPTTPARGAAVVTGRACDECGRGGARFPRRDSSGIQGVVCAACNRCDDLELSFA